jgi:outer membrane protein
VNILQRQLAATQTQFDSGAATKTDLQQTQSRLASAQAALAQARAQLSQSRNAFMRVVGRPSEIMQTMPALPVLPRNEDEALQIATRDNPNLVEAKANDKAAEYATDFAVGALLPHASIVAQYDYSKNSLSSGFGVRA